MCNDRQNCPYLPDLMRNHELQKKLEHEQKLRKEAERNSAGLFIVGCLVSFISTLTIMGLIIGASMNAETAELCVCLTRTCATLFFTFSLTLMTVNTTLDRWAKHKQEKKDTDDKKAA